MSIVKHLKSSNSQRIQKRHFRYWVKITPNPLPAILLGSLLGTYLDLYFVGKGLYSFPKRPLEDVFPINILFTLFGLPLLIGFFLFVCTKVNSMQKAGLILFISLLMSVMEKTSETFGIFTHADSWKHFYSFIGYTLYLTFISIFYYWSNRN